MRKIFVLLALLFTVTVYAESNGQTEVKMDKSHTTGHNHGEVPVPYVIYDETTGQLDVTTDSFDAGYTIEVTNAVDGTVEATDASTSTHSSTNVQASSPMVYLITITSSSGNTYEGILDMNE